MKKFFLPLFGVLAAATVQGQIAMSSTPPVAASLESNSNSINVVQQMPLVFSYESIDDYDVDQVIGNAFTIELAPRESTKFLFCQVVFLGPPQIGLAQRLGLKLRNPINVPYSGDFNHISYLSPQPVKIAEIGKLSPNTLQYDVVLRKQTQMEATGSFNFTLIFSIIDP